MGECSPQEAFTSMYRAFYGNVLRYFRRRCDGEDAARDLTAEVFTICWRRWNDIPEPSLPWLYGCASKALNNHRRRGLSERAMVHQLCADPVWNSPAAGAEHLDVLDALSLLSEGDQEILRLVAWEGLEGPDLAGALECTPNAAAVRLHRARARLRKQLNPSEEAEVTIHG